MNIGERDEILFKLQLIYMRDNNIPLFGEKIYSVGFNNIEYKSIPNNENPQNIHFMDNSQLEIFAKSLNVIKAKPSAKSDVYINNSGVSIKSQSSAPAAIVNHTTRPGFEFACNNSNSNIKFLDEAVKEYWELRLSNEITEDTKINDKVCPFRKFKNEIQPIIEYFLFTGTGSKISQFPADYLIEFEKPFDSLTYKKLLPNDAFEYLWGHLIFSIRAKKGMPKNYNPYTYNKPNADSIKKWVKYVDGNFRGALHIRSSK